MRPLAARSTLAALVALLLLSLPAATPAAESPADAPAPAPAPAIELYTMGQGEVIFEKFGHAAMCVVPVRGEARCYNYGTTDFDSPPQQLGWDFLRGTARFWVSVSSREAMLRFYRGRDRTVYRQVLDVPSDRARAIASKLAFDAREANRYYLYHHFDDNCTTRIRDILDGALGGVLSESSDSPIDRTFRDIGRQGLAEQTWVPPIAAVVVGRRLDTRPTLWEAMFLPDVLRAEVEERLGAEPELVFARTGRRFEQHSSSGVGWLLLVALLVALPVLASRALGRFARAARIAVGLVLGLLGSALWTLAIVTAVDELRWNEALLVFVPIDLVLVVAGERLARRYALARIAGLALVSALAAANLLIQPLEASVLIAAAPLLAIALPPRRSAAGSVSDAHAPGESPTRQLES